MKDRDNQQITISELAWLAGIIDGEGCIGIRERVGNDRNYSYWPRPRIDIASVDARMIAEVTKIMEKIDNLKFWYGVSFKTNSNHKDNIRVVTMGLRNVYNLLIRVEPYLVNKKNEARLAIAYSKWRTLARPHQYGKGHELIGEIKKISSQLKQVFPNIRMLSRKASKRLEIGISETNTCDAIVNDLIKKIENEIVMIESELT